ncbi:MAG: His-Xaa-Ser system radical SAM maturase HxsB [DPANN group archaeon]|nr:His-Xaa-Ser system radical SAM maturase HxsB [DPANN group archaeon]
MGKTQSVDMDKYIIGSYTHKQLSPGRILVTAPHGGWAILDDKEFKLLRLGEVEKDSNLYSLLFNEGIILSENNIPFATNQCRNKFIQLSIATTLHILTPTLRCNQKCVYCYAASKPENDKTYDMTEDTARAVVDFIFQAPSNKLTIEFQGGEPLLNFDIVKFVVKYAKEKAKQTKKDINFRIVTNLTIMDDEKLSWLVENKILLNSSFDGPKIVHDKNRFYDNGKGTYDEVTAWIKKLKDKDIHVGFMPTITRHSLPYWKEIIDEYLKYGQNRFWARRMNVGGFAVDTWNKIGYTSEEYLDFWKKGLDYIIELNKDGKEIVEGTINIFLKNIIFSKKYQGFVCLASPCGCAWSQVSYNYKGDIYTCDEARSFDVFKLGNVKETTYKDLYSSWDVLNIVDMTTGESFDCAECVYHPFCGPCIVDEYGEHGNIIKKPNSFNCRVKKGIFEHIFNNLMEDKEKWDIVKGWLINSDKKSCTPDKDCKCKEKS